MPDRNPEPTTGLKVLAILMAIALWGFVGVSQRVGAPDPSRKHLQVAIEVKHPPRFERVHLVPAFADLSVEGPAKAVDRLTEGDVEAFVDLHYQPEPGNRASVMVAAPDGLKVQVAPEYVTLVPVPIR